MITEVPNKERDATTAALEAMKRMMPHYAEYVRLEAQLRRQKYDALIAQKFTPEQALELIKGPLA